jgi:hypothetical protein
VSATQTFSIGNLIQLTSASHLSLGDPIVFVGTKYGNIVDYTTYYVRTINTSTNRITISELPDISTTFGLVNGVPTGLNAAMVVHCVGWQHFVEGTPILALLDTSTNYFIEPRLTFSSPGFSTSSSTLPANRQWTSIASNANRYVAVALNTAATAYSVNGTTWLAGALPTSALWTKIKYVGGVFMAFASGGQAARSTDGISWSAMTMSSTAGKAATVMVVFCAMAKLVQSTQSKEITVFFMKSPLFESAFIFIHEVLSVKSLKGFY